MSQLTILSDDQYNGLIDAISSGGGGGGGGSTADITAELEGIKDAITAQSNIVASNMHIQYITSGSLDANTTTTIHCTFERQYTQVPKVLATISPVQTNFPSAYIYITSITNITLTGCDINIVRVGAALSLTENRKIIVAIEDTSIIQTSGGGSSEIIIDDTEKKIGKYFGADLYEKTIIIDSTISGYQPIYFGVNAIYGWLESGHIWNNTNIYNVSITPYEETYAMPCKALFTIYNGEARVDYLCSSEYVGCKAEFTVRYTKLVPNPVEIDRERSAINESDLLY